MEMTHRLVVMATSETKFSSLVDDMSRLTFSFLFYVSLLCGLAGVASAVTTAVAAPQFVYGKDINQNIIDVLAEQGLVAKPSLDDGRRFRACNAALDIRPLQGSFRTVTVKCPDQDGWNIAVRTRIGKTVVLAAREHSKGNSREHSKGNSREHPNGAPEMMMVVTMNRSVKKGTLITAADVKLAPVSRKTSKHYFTRIQDVVSRKAMHNIGADRVVEARQLELNYAIRAGQKVTIEHKVGPVQVLSEGIALSDAQLGDTARILNTRSEREVEGRVVSEKKIFIGANKSDNFVVNGRVGGKNG
jgi:flagella basal body P-ring formation protein FlgA